MVGTFLIIRAAIFILYPCCWPALFPHCHACVFISVFWSGSLARRCTRLWSKLKQLCSSESILYGQDSLPMKNCPPANELGREDQSPEHRKAKKTVQMSAVCQNSNIFSKTNQFHCNFCLYSGYAFRKKKV